MDSVLLTNGDLVPAEEEKPIQIEVLVDNPDHLGYLMVERTLTIREVMDEITKRLGRYPLGCGEGWGLFPSIRYEGWADKPWPVMGRVHVFPVTGQNEGWYTHLEVCCQHSPCEVCGLEVDRMCDHSHVHLLGLGKTFDGWDEAWEFAKRVAFLVGA